MSEAKTPKLSFSDAKKDQMKRDLEYNGGASDYRLSIADGKALLHRLECTEGVATLMYSMPPINPDDGSNKIIADKLETWKKSRPES